MNFGETLMNQEMLPSIIISEYSIKNLKSIPDQINVICAKVSKDEVLFTSNNKKVNLDKIQHFILGFLSFPDEKEDDKSIIKDYLTSKQITCSHFDILSNQKESWSQLFQQWIVEILLTSYKKQAQYITSISKSLTQLRSSHEQNLNSFSKLEKFLSTVVKTPRWEFLTLSQPTNSLPLQITKDQVLVQKIPCGSAGISDIAININKKSFISNSDKLELKLSLEESEETVATWVIPGFDLQEGWLRLSLERSLNSDNQTPLLEILWSGNNPLFLDTSIHNPDARFCASINDQTTSNTIQLRIWKYIEGCLCSIPQDGFLPQTNDNRSKTLSIKKMRSALASNTDNLTISWVNDKNSLQVHPLLSKPSIACIESITIENYTEITADIETISERATEIEYSIGIESSSNCKESKNIRISDIKKLSAWVKAPALTKSQVTLDLNDLNRKEIYNLYLITKIPSEVKTDAFAWATFSNITFS